MKIKRLNITPALIEQNSSIKVAYAIEKASWIWHPDYCDTSKPGVFHFNLSFHVNEDDSFLLHLSGDHRYEASLDGELFSRGPDRSDPDHWSFTSYEINLSRGEHILSVKAWWIGEEAPMAQMSHNWGGFLLAGESLSSSTHNWEEIISTGRAPWRVSEVKGWSYTGALEGNFHVIGSGMVSKSSQKATESVTPQVIMGPLSDNPTGNVRSGWRLFPSPLPEQIFEPYSGGKITAIYEGISEENIYEPASLINEKIGEWQKLLAHDKELTIPPESSLTILWDLEEYFCGYPQIALNGGLNSFVQMDWAESLFDDTLEKHPQIKGNRNEIANKKFHGFGDRVYANGESVLFRPLWFRSGRFIQITLETAQEALTIEKLSIIETRYPLEEESLFLADIPMLNEVSHIAVRTMQMCGHETLFDCPYYEQLMYVGDSRLQNLTAFTLTGENRLAERAVELFRWSHNDGGMIHERYPSRHRQRSSTFALIWVTMVNDLALWRPVENEVRLSLPVIRYQLDNFRHLLTPEGILGELPGWSFVDWVPEWDTGNPPATHCSSLVNLLFIMALKAHASLEEQYGEKLMAQRSRELADQVSERLRVLFWDQEHSLMADDREHTSYSEHGQCLSLINGVIPESDREACFHALLSAPDLHRTTVYFSFYLVETYCLMNRADLFLDKLDFWRDMVTSGLKTTLEMPEPTRSDCHAWGAYPYYYFRTFLAGITPDEFEFKKVRIAPCLADLPGVAVEMPHPSGIIRMDLFRVKEVLNGTVDLPENITGIFLWNGKEIPLVPGENHIQL